MRNGRGTPRVQTLFSVRLRQEIRRSEQWRSLTSECVGETTDVAEGTIPGPERECREPGHLSAPGPPRSSSLFSPSPPSRPGWSRPVAFWAATATLPRRPTPRQSVRRSGCYRRGPDHRPGDADQASTARNTARPRPPIRLVRKVITMLAVGGTAAVGAVARYLLDQYRQRRRHILARHMSRAVAKSRTCEISPGQRGATCGRAGLIDDPSELRKRFRPFPRVGRDPPADFATALGTWVVQRSPIQLRVDPPVRAAGSSLTGEPSSSSTAAKASTQSSGI